MPTRPLRPAAVHAIAGAASARWRAKPDAPPLLGWPEPKAVSRLPGFPAASAPSTAHRLLNTLADERLCLSGQRIEAFGTFGLKTYRVGCAISVSTVTSVGESRPYLRPDGGLRRNNLSILDGTHYACFIGQVQCHEVMRMLVRLGSRIPRARERIGQGDAGGAARTSQPSCCRNCLVQLTSKPSPTPDKLRQPIRRHPRSRLTATTTGKTPWGCAAWRRRSDDEFAEPLGAISLAGPIARLTDERILKLSPLVAHAGRSPRNWVGGAGSGVTFFPHLSAIAEHLFVTSSLDAALMKKK